MIRRPPRSTRTDTLCPYTTLFRSGSVPLGKLGAVRSMDQRHMGVYRLRPTHCANERELAEGVVEMVIAQDNMRNAHIVIVHHNGQNIGRRSIGAERSEERSVGKACVCTCTSRRDPYNYKKIK